MTSPVEDPLGGVMPVLCVPFTRNGDIDTEALRVLVDFQLSWGVDGIVVFGLASESYKLTDAERRSVLDTVVERTAGAVPVVAGTEHNSTDAAVARSVEAVSRGADAVMLYPPTFTRLDDESLLRHFASVADAVAVPVIVQDAPSWTGTTLSVDVLTELATSNPNARWVKVESLPAASKIRQLNARGLRVISGYGALHIVEDLGAGACGVMPGCAMPGLYRKIWQLSAHGDVDSLWETFTRVLPLLAFQMSSLDVFIASQKQLLTEAQIFSTNAIRAPGLTLGVEESEWLRALVRRTGTEIWLGWPTDSST